MFLINFIGRQTLSSDVSYMVLSLRSDPKILTRFSWSELNPTIANKVLTHIPCVIESSAQMIFPTDFVKDDVGSISYIPNVFKRDYK